MKLSVKWLRAYVDIDMPVKDLAHRLTMSGTEVGGLNVIGGNWDLVSIAQVVGLDPHPNADRLVLATVDLGNGERQTIVTGAPNLAVGNKVPFARVGARLIDGHTGKLMTLKPAKIRGVPSEGMVLSEMELGISADHEGIMILPDEAPVGTPLADYLGDVVLDLELTPNRPDAFCMLGIAREVAALTDQKVRLPQVSYPEPGSPVEKAITIEIPDPDLCSRYSATLIEGIKIGPSPLWMQERLIASGMRPINNIVDITNYVMMEYGQPLHAFDYHKLTGRKIVVRRARPGETLVSLDGVPRELDPEMLVIADAERPVAVAGVMGGADSEVSDQTTTILLESANFNNRSIRRTSAKLRMRTEASLRFDKGLSPGLTVQAARRATQLMVELASGRAAAGVADVYPVKQVIPSIVVTMTELKRILGVDWDIDLVTKTLESLEFAVEPVKDETGKVNGVTVKPPYFRTDITLIEDVVEEVARIIGYDRVPTTLINGRLPEHVADPLRELSEKVRDILVGSGMQEVINYSLVSASMLETVKPYLKGNVPAPIKLANPMTPEQEYLRTFLRPSILGTLRSNERLPNVHISLFEIGNVYLPREGDLPEERRMLVGLLTGPRLPRDWSAPPEDVDFFDAKGILEALFSRIDVAADFVTTQDPFFHPGRVAAVAAVGRGFGVVGEIHPKVLADFDITPRRVYFFELDLAQLGDHAGGTKQYRQIPRYPGVVQDMAVVVDSEVPAESIEGVIAAAPLVRQFALFDVYQGSPLPPGKKSLAFSLVYQSEEKTLTDRDAAEAQERIVRELGRRFGAVLRT